MRAPHNHQTISKAKQEVNYRRDKHSAPDKFNNWKIYAFKIVIAMFTLHEYERCILDQYQTISKAEQHLW